jgi:hypothetical protein
MRYLGMSAAVLAGLAVACGGTEPDQPLQVTVSAPARAALKVKFLSPEPLLAQHRNL